MRRLRLEGDKRDVVRYIYIYTLFFFHGMEKGDDCPRVRAYMKGTERSGIEHDKRLPPSHIAQNSLSISASKKN